MDKRLRFMTDLIEPLRMAPGSTVKLIHDHDPGYTRKVTRPQASELLAEGVQLLAEINDWERYLVDSGIHVVKVMLHLSKREQAKRFLKRIDHQEKNWKFSPSDVRERHYWDEYQRAFDDMLSHTSMPWAP